MARRGFGRCLSRSWKAKAGPVMRVPGAAGQQRTQRGDGDRRGAQAQSRPVRHHRPGPALRPQFRSPPPPAATRSRRGQGSRKWKPTPDRQPPASEPPGPGRRSPNPAPRRLPSPRAVGGGRGESRMGVPGPLAATDSSVGLCPPPPPSPTAPRRHSGPKSRRDPASFSSEPRPAGAREPGNPTLAARRHQNAPDREPPRGTREDGGHATGTGQHRRHSRGEATRTPALTSASPPGRWQHCAGPPRLRDRGTRLTSARSGRTVGCPRKWEGPKERRG